jgi:hypothetical protein
MEGTTFAQEVLAYLVREKIELSDDLGKAEAILREQMLRIGAAALEQHLQGKRLGYEGAARACSCGSVQRFVEYRPKTVATLLGPVTFRRAYYRCPACGESCLPYDQRVGLGEGAVSLGLAKAATLVGVQEPFAPAAQMLYDLTGQRLSPCTIERLTHQVGTVAAEAEAMAAARSRTGEAPPAEHQPQRLYVAVDGTTVRETDGFHEAKTVTCYWEDAEGARQARYAVRFETAALFASFVWSLACQCGARAAKEVVLLGDGAKWIWDHVAPLLEGATCIVDWYHALEHVWACGRALHGEATPQTTAWVKAVEDLLWEGNVREILRRLETERAQARAPTKREALDGLMTYLRNQDDRLAYDRFRSRGLDIGSGRVEAACKNVVGVRMKRSGMRWSRHGAQATLSLRVAWMNGTWEKFWADQPLAA